MLKFLYTLDLIKKSIFEHIEGLAFESTENYQSIKDRFLGINIEGIFDEQIKKIDSIIESIETDEYFCPEDTLFEILNSLNDVDFKNRALLEHLPINLDLILKELNIKKLDRMECEMVNNYLHNLGEKLIKIKLIPNFE